MQAIEKKSVQFKEQFTDGNPLRPVLVNCDWGFFKGSECIL